MNLFSAFFELFQKGLKNSASTFNLEEIITSNGNDLISYWGKMKDHIYEQAQTYYTTHRSEVLEKLPTDKLGAYSKFSLNYSIAEQIKRELDSPPVFLSEELKEKFNAYFCLDELKGVICLSKKLRNCLFHGDSSLEDNESIEYLNSRFEDVFRKIKCFRSADV